MIDQILEYNKTFVDRKDYEKFITDKYPDKKLAVLSCMDTRLTELLPAALGLKNGDAKIILPSTLPCVALSLPFTNWAWRKSWWWLTPIVEPVI